jgi:hypothetical protein
VATNKDFIVKNGLSVGEDISVSGSVTSNLQFDDSVQLQLGTDSDLLIYHDNSNAYIDDVGAGSLYIRSGTTYFQNAAGTKTSIQTNSGAGQTLFFNNDPIFATLVDGVSVTGNAVLTGELRGPASFVIDPTAIGDNTGAVVIKGDLTVEGTTTTINSTTLDVADKNITLNFGAGDTSATANNAGITVQDAIDTGSSTTDATMLWNQLDERFDFSHPIAAGRFSRLGLAGHESIFTHSTTNNSAIICSGSDNIEIRGRLSDNYQIYAKSGGNVGIGKIPGSVKLDVAGDIASSGTITGSDFSGITMGGSLSGSHDDAKVQYGNSFSGTPAQGHFFFDSLNQKLKVYTGSAFVDAVPASGGGGGGSGSSDATATFRKYTYTLASSTNAISGKEDDEVTTGDFISGRLYEITVVGDTNFTSIGSTANVVGTQFTATDVGGGTTGKAKEVLFYATGGTQNIEVYVNGVKAVEGSSNDYVATTGTSVTFTSNLSSGDVVDIQVYELLTNDSFYLKTETYTQAQVNSQIATGTSSYLPLAGGSLTGNLNVAGTIKSDNAYGGFITLKRSDTTTTNNSDIGAINFEHTDSDDAGVAATILASGDGTAGGGKLRFFTGTPTTRQARLTILSNGDIGIGTDSPDYLVHAENSTAIDPSYIATSANGAFIMAMGSQNSPNVAQEAFIGTLSNTRFKIKVNSVVKASWTDNGLAIGTQSSAYTDLDVAGEIAMSSGNAHAVFSSDSHGRIYLKANENAVNATTAIHMQMPQISGSGTLEDKLVINHSDITAYKNVLPNANATLDLGSSTLAWRNVYTNDLHLSNEGQEEGNSVDGTKGNWTIQEGEEHLYIINNKSGKKYKFALEEIE